MLQETWANWHDAAEKIYKSSCHLAFHFFIHRPLHQTLFSSSFLDSDVLFITRAACLGYTAQEHSCFARISRRNWLHGQRLSYSTDHVEENDQKLILRRCNSFFRRSFRKRCFLFISFYSICFDFFIHWSSVCIRQTVLFDQKWTWLSSVWEWIPKNHDLFVRGLSLYGLQRNRTRNQWSCQAYSQW